MSDAIGPLLGALSTIIVGLLVWLTQRQTGKVNAEGTFRGDLLRRLADVEARENDLRDRLERAEEKARDNDERARQNEQLARSADEAIRKLREHAAEETATLRSRVTVLEETLRAHDIPIPPVT